LTIILLVLKYRIPCQVYGTLEKSTINKIGGR
jgi:hypothetical protein